MPRTGMPSPSAQRRAFPSSITTSLSDPISANAKAKRPFPRHADFRFRKSRESPGSARRESRASSGPPWPRDRRAQSGELIQNGVGNEYVHPRFIEQVRQSSRVGKIIGGALTMRRQATLDLLLQLLASDLKGIHFCPAERSRKLVRSSPAFQRPCLARSPPAVPLDRRRK